MSRPIILADSRLLDVDNILAGSGAQGNHDVAGLNRPLLEPDL